MANLPIFTTTNKDLSMLQTRWASQINPLLSSVLRTPYILQNVKLTTGDNTINHLQGEPLNGYLIVGMQGGYAQIYDKVSPMPSKTLILNASAPVTVQILVF